MYRRQFIPSLLIGVSGCTFYRPIESEGTEIASIYAENHHTESHEIEIVIMQYNEEKYRKSVLLEPQLDGSVESTVIQPELNDYKNWRMIATLDEEKEKEIVTENGIENDRIDLLCRISNQGSLHIFISNAEDGSR